jgi:hypothetical protein
MPTRLPSRRPATAQAKWSIAIFAWNAFLVVSALMLTALVLVKEESYAFPSAQSLSQGETTQPPTAD